MSCPLSDAAVASKLQSWLGREVGGGQLAMAHTVAQCHMSVSTLG